MHIPLSKGNENSNKKNIPDGFLVVHQSFVQFPLLLQDRSEVRVGGGELREHVQSLQVEPSRLLDESLLPFNVGQIVERVGVSRTQAQGGRVTLLGILANIK